MQALGINAGLLISQIANLVILLLLLRIVLYKPVLRMLDERADKIRRSMQDAEATSQQAARAEAQYQERIQEAQRQAQAILEQANEESKRLRDKALSEAREEAQRLLERAQKQIELERHEVLRGERMQLADLVVAAASKVVGHALDKKAHRRLVEQFLADATGSK